jgi:hypothetical protein
LDEVRNLTGFSLLPYFCAGSALQLAPHRIFGTVIVLFLSGVSKPKERLMTQAIPHDFSDRPVERVHGDVPYQAYQVLHVAFILAPIIAGVDKFFDKLTDWDMYLSPFANRVLGGHGHPFMMAVGCIEVIAGIGVAFFPRVFAYVVSAWLLLIIINLLIIPGFYDIALRDFGLCLAAFSLARLSHRYSHA